MDQFLRIIYSFLSNQSTLQCAELTDNDFPLEFANTNFEGHYSALRLIGMGPPSEKLTKIPSKAVQGVSFDQVCIIYIVYTKLEICCPILGVIELCNHYCNSLLQCFMLQRVAIILLLFGQITLTMENVESISKDFLTETQQSNVKRMEFRNFAKLRQGFVTTKHPQNQSNFNL